MSVQRWAAVLLTSTAVLSGAPRLSGAQSGAPAPARTSPSGAAPAARDLAGDRAREWVLIGTSRARRLAYDRRSLRGLAGRVVEAVVREQRVPPTLDSSFAAGTHDYERYMVAEERTTYVVNCDNGMLAARVVQEWAPDGTKTREFLYPNVPMSALRDDDARGHAVVAAICAVGRGRASG
jgi:hypothetical protein